MDTNEIDPSIERLLDSISNPPMEKREESLQSLFDMRLIELKLKKTHARKILELELSTLNGILKGTLRRVDFVALIKLSRFLRLLFRRYSHKIKTIR